MAQSIMIQLTKKDNELIDKESKELANELLSALSKESDPRAHVIQEEMLLRAATIILGMIIAVKGQHYPEGPKRSSMIMDEANESRDHILDMADQFQKKVLEAKHE